MLNLVMFSVNTLNMRDCFDARELRIKRTLQTCLGEYAVR